MINSVKELQESLLEDSKGFDDPLFKRCLLMTSPGCPKERIEELKKALPGIPDSYTKWVEQVNLNGIDVGYFELGPSSNKKDMVENLIKGNDDSADDRSIWDHIEDGTLSDGPTMYAPIRKRYKCYSIATIDNHEVFVATKNSPGFREGEIILVDEEILSDLDNPREKDIVKIAKDFEQFLIIAANLSECQGMKEVEPGYAEASDERKAEVLASYEASKIEFLNRLKQLGVPEEYHQGWLHVL